MKFKFNIHFGIFFILPSYTKLPLHNIKIWSKYYNISEDGECIVVIIVIPLYDKLYNYFIISNAVEESNPVVGSSKNNKFGFDTNSFPIETHFFSPPETPLTNASPTTVSEHFYNPIISIISYDTV